MRVILAHITPQQQDYETVTVEGDDYETLLAEAMKQIPDGRVGASIRVER